MTFENALARLESLTEKMQSSATSLEESIACYEEGMRCYQLCVDMLRSAEQKIEVFRRNEQQE